MGQGNIGSECIQVGSVILYGVDLKKSAKGLSAT